MADTDIDYDALAEHVIDKTQENLRSDIAKILDDLENELKLAERQLWTGNQQTPASDAAGWALRIMAERINVVRTRNFGEREK